MASDPAGPIGQLSAPPKQTLVERLRGLGQDLPAQDGHLHLKGTPAAVIAPLVLPTWESDLDRASLLYIKRSPDLKKHAGQMAFPGGVVESSDPDVLSAGFREGHEEVGLLREESKVLAALPSSGTPSGFTLNPFFVATTQSQFRPEPGEVESIHLIPVLELLNCPVRLENREWQGVTYRVIYFDTSSVCIWGVTGRITEVLLSHFFSWRPPQ